jgi:hypothetical protein
MQKIILIAVAIVVLSQAISFLNDSYPEGGFVGKSKRDEVFALMATRGDEVAAALRDVTAACFEKAAGGPVSPLAAEMFAETLASLPEMPSAKLGKEPSDQEISEYQAQNMAALTALFAPKLEALTAAERAAFDASQSVLDQNARKIVPCALEAAHGRLQAGQSNG